MTYSSVETQQHEINGIVVEQRQGDGFINGTAMCVAYGKRITDWLRIDETWKLVAALAKSLEIEFNYAYMRNSVSTRVSETFPDLVSVRRGSPAVGGGIWIHPDLAIPLAQWCSPEFALLVSRWIQKWIIEQHTVYTPPVEPARARPQLAEWQSSRLFAQRCHSAGFNQMCRLLGYDPREVHDAITIEITGMTASQHRQLALVGSRSSIGLDHVANTEALCLIGQAKLNFLGYRKGYLTERVKRAVAEAKEMLGYE